MQPKMGISALHYEWETVEEAFERAIEEFKLDGIEFSYPHPLFGDDEVGVARALAEETGIDLSVHMWGNLAAFGVELAAAQLREWLSVCEAGGFGHMILHGGTHENQWEGVKITQDAFAEVIGDFERVGVVICLENHYAYDYGEKHELFSTPEEFLPVLEAISSPNLRMCLDYGHSQMTCNTGELLESLGEYLVYTHLADNMGEHDDHLAFGRGVVPWREVFEQTKAVGYPGPFIVEFPVREGVYEAFWECKAMLEEVYGEAE